VAKISLGIDKYVYLGNLSSKRDWGYAPEYVECMWKILQQKNPDDYVIATGKSYTVSDLVSKAFDYAGLNWKKHVKTDKKLFRILEVDILNGDSTKAHKKLRWKPKTDFNKLIEIMVDADILRWKKWLKGESFPWDAIYSLDEYQTLIRKK